MASRIDPKLAVCLALIADWTVGCAAPDGLRGRTAESDPACLTAFAPPPAALGAALVEDPPLPGVRKPGWPTPSGDLAPTPLPEVGGAAVREEGHHGHSH